jgi:hypothetical protein
MDFHTADDIAKGKPDYIPVFYPVFILISLSNNKNILTGSSSMTFIESITVSKVLLLDRYPSGS